MVSRRRFLVASALGTSFLTGCGSDRTPPTSTTRTRSSETDATRRSSPSEKRRTLDVRDFGAEVDGETDDTEAVRAAIEAAAEGDSVLFPSGTTLVSGVAGSGPNPAIHLTAKHSGITLEGEGADSIIRMDGGHTSNNQVLYIEADTDPHDITIRDLRVDGNRANNDDRTTQGFLAWPPGDTENILVENVWVEECSSAAFKMSTGGVTVNHCTARHNTMHGFAPDDPNPSDTIVLRNVLSHHNRMGIDDSCGDSYIDGFVIRDCLYGMKNTQHTERTVIKNGLIKNCDSVGYRTNIPDSEWPDKRPDVTLDNLISEGNGSWAFRFDENANYTVGTILARNSNQRGEEPGQIGVLNDASLDATDIRSYDSASGVGLYYSSGRNSNVFSYSHAGNPDGKLAGPEVDNIDFVEEVSFELADGRDLNDTTFHDFNTLDVPVERDVGASRRSQ